MAEKGSLETKIRMEKIQLNRKNLTVAARQHLEDRIKENEALLKADTYKAEQRIDKTAVAKQIVRDKQILEERVPEKFTTGIEKDREYSRAKELAEQIKVGMPTDSEMKKCPPGMINQHLKWSRENEEKIAEWKGIMRRLEPDMPNAANVENLRTK